MNALLAGAFSVVGLLCVSGNVHKARQVLPAWKQCPGGDFRFGVCLAFVLCAIISLVFAAGVLAAFSLQENKRQLIWTEGDSDKETMTAKKRHENNRMKATCCLEPDIQFITSEKRLTFDPLTGKLNWSKFYGTEKYQNETPRGREETEKDGIVSTHF